MPFRGVSWLGFCPRSDSDSDSGTGTGSCLLADAVRLSLLCI